MMHALSEVVIILRNSFLFMYYSSAEIKCFSNNNKTTSNAKPHRSNVASI